MDNLPDALLIEILHRLPLLLACQSKLVCKRWHALVSTPYFAHLFSLQPQTYTLLIQLEFDSKKGHQKHLVSSQKPCSSSQLCLSFLPLQHHLFTMVVASCRDLLLCYNYALKNIYFICNPFTKTWVQLPPASRAPGLIIHWRPSVSFVCDSSGDYTVLRIICDYRMVDNQFEVEIFSSKTFRWTERIVIYCKEIDELAYHHRSGIPYKEMLFWLMETDKLLIMGLDPSTIGVKKSPVIIDPPRGRYVFNGNECLGLCRGSLRFIQVAMRRDDDKIRYACIRVWDFMDDDDEKDAKWLLHCEIDLSRTMHLKNSDCLYQHRYKRSIRPKVLACDPNDRDIVYIMPKHPNLRGVVIVSCNLKTRELEEVLHIPEGKNYYDFFDVFPCMLPWNPTQIA